MRALEKVMYGVVSAIGFAGVIGLESKADAQNLRVRRLAISSVAVLEQLRPDDQVVELFQPEVHVASPGYRRDKDMLVDAVSSSVIVAIGWRGASRSDFTPEGITIERHTTFTLDRVLVSRPGFPASIGSAVQVRLPGGELKVGDTLVRTANVPEYPEGQQYLLFLDYAGRGASMSPFQIRLIRDGRTVNPVQCTGCAPDPLHDLKITDLELRIVKLARSIR